MKTMDPYSEVSLRRFRRELVVPRHARPRPPYTEVTPRVIAIYVALTVLGGVVGALAVLWTVGR